MFDKDANVIKPEIEVRTGSVVMSTPSRKGESVVPNILVGSISSRREKDRNWSDAVNIMDAQ